MSGFEAKGEKNKLPRRVVLRQLGNVGALAPLIFAVVSPAKADDPPSCYPRGTRILTSAGEVAIESLRIGHEVMTASGQSKPIKWVGRQKFKRAPGKPWQRQIEPIRIRRSALGEQVPSRDLYLSEAHRLYLDGKLVSAVNLVNGRTIRRCAPDDSDQIEYFNIELESHDIIIAEGAAVESFQAQNGNREKFDNFAEYIRLYGQMNDHEPFAPEIGFNGGRSIVKHTARSVLSLVIDRRTDFDLLRERLFERSRSELVG